MRNRWSSLVVFASHALCVGCLPAQLRHACIGRVVDAADAPIAAAEVTLAWSPGNGPGDVDVVHARSDERGYFRADLIVSHPYRVWATGADRIAADPCHPRNGAARRVPRLAPPRCRSRRLDVCFDGP